MTEHIIKISSDVTVGFFRQSPDNFSDRATIIQPKKKHFSFCQYLCDDKSKRFETLEYVCSVLKQRIALKLDGEEKCRNFGSFDL